MSQLHINADDDDTCVVVKKPYAFTGTALPVVDYILVVDKNVLENDERKQKLRQKFEDALTDQEIQLEPVTDPQYPDKLYIRIFVPFKRLSEEAEKIKMEMPLEECQIYDEADTCFEQFEQKYFITDEEDDFVSAPFFLSRLHMYKGNKNEQTFFRSSLRIYLTHHILIHTDIREMSVDRNEPLLSKKALPHLLMTGVYSDAFVLHEASAGDPIFKKYDKKMNMNTSDNIVTPVAEQYKFEPDRRVALDNTWVKIFKYQPMWKIRNYFGEKIAFYFAWSGHLISWLWFPTFFGLICFFYGLYLRIVISVERHANSSATSVNTTVSPVQSIASAVENMLGIVKEAFDNTITPFFALTICIWGTILTETWKRTRHRLAYEWDVNNFSDVEPDRPQFVGTTKRLDPITKEEDWYYPTSRQFMKFGASFVILVVMICIVFISVASVILYRVFVTVKYCETISTIDCLLINMVASSVLNAVSILILGKFYDWLAVKLTDWENHRTQTAYDDALIIKLFAFQFANSYSSLFYIAFFRGAKSPFSTQGIFGLGAEYVDTCGSNGNCMTMLSFQVLILMIMKPMPKLIFDIVLPFTLRILSRLRKRCCKKNQIEVDDIPMISPEDIQFQISYEKKKPKLNDFTIGEYMEKVIQYGYLMLFASSFPLAPLFALLTNVFDRMVDAKRLLWMYRRPHPQIVSNIGMWEIIVEFLNIAGVISNAFIIAFTSEWGRQYDVQTRLIIVLGVEHAVFAMKFFTMAIIPDIPNDVKLSMRREKYQVQQILESGDLKASTSSLTRPTLNSKSVADQVGFLAKLPLSASDPPSHEHPYPSARQSDTGQLENSLKNRDSFNTHEAKLHFELYASANGNDDLMKSGNRLPPLNLPIEKSNESDAPNSARDPQDDEVDAEKVKKRRKKKHKSPKSDDLLTVVDDADAENEMEIEV